MTATLKEKEQNQLQLVEREEMDDEDDLFEAIDKSKLQIMSSLSLSASPINLTGIKGLSEAKADKICEAAEKIVNYGYITRSDALLKRKSVIHITTGSQALDELLGGSLITLRFTRTVVLVGLRLRLSQKLLGNSGSSLILLLNKVVGGMSVAVTPHYLDFRFGNDNMCSKLRKICIPIAFAASYKHAWWERKGCLH
uniref:Uncharacterized protein n=1 Tax=Populus alba TaxID=43335 RepID=A0A4U5NLH1_POPAL|nr:hypothetical protein D5086_0000264950 [Populus alba]